MEKFKLEPIAGGGNRIFIERAKAEETISAGGLVIPAVFEQALGDGRFETVQKVKNEGTVIAVSPNDASGNKPTVKVGDYVLFSEYAGMKHEFEGKEYLVMKEADIHARLKK